MGKNPEAERMSDELRLLVELGILRFKNTTGRWISRTKIQFDDILQ